MLNATALEPVYIYIYIYISIILNNILKRINKRNKDPCYGLRLLYLRIQHRSFYILKCNQKYHIKTIAKNNIINYNKNVKNIIMLR